MHRAVHAQAVMHRAVRVQAAMLHVVRGVCARAGTPIFHVR